MGPGKILIHVCACGFDNADVNARAGWYRSAVTEGVTERSGAGGFVATGAAAGWHGGTIRFPCIRSADADQVLDHNGGYLEADVRYAAAGPMDVVLHKQCSMKK